MIGTASGLVARSHTDGSAGVARVVALLLLLLLLMVMVRLRMIAIMLLLRLVMLVMWHNRWILVVGLSSMS